MDQKDGNFDTSELGNKIKAYIQSVNALTNNKKSMVDDMKKFESKKVQVLLGGSTSGGAGGSKTRNKTNIKKNFRKEEEDNGVDEVVTNSISDLLNVFESKKIPTFDLLEDLPSYEKRKAKYRRG